MVFYFTTTVSKYTIYMGRDKFENEELIKFGWPEDVWFHVDDMSSAHVYLRMPKGETIDDIPEEVLVDCCQLTKQNSISGCKQNNVKIVYTPWSNLKKTKGMEVGQVSFHDMKLRRFRKVDKKDSDILRRLKKTKVTDETPDLAGMRDKRDRAERALEKGRKREQAKAEAEEIEKQRKEKELRSYADVFGEEDFEEDSEEATGWALEEDFM